MAQCVKGQKNLHREHVWGTRCRRRKPFWPHWYKIHCASIAKRNLLRVAESIQISPNERFCSTKFMTNQIMSTFCTEPLTTPENNNVAFKPDYKPPLTRAFIFISFWNVPLETKENQMTCYVKEYCDIHGVHYPRESIRSITYHTGTRWDRCSNIKEHFPKVVHIFGRRVRVIYDGQPDSERKPNNTSEVDEQIESAQQNDQPSNTTHESPTIIEETPESQLPTPTAINEIRKKETKPNTNSPTNTTQNNVPHSSGKWSDPGHFFKAQGNFFCHFHVPFSKYFLTPKNYKLSL